MSDNRKIIKEKEVTRTRLNTGRWALEVSELTVTWKGQDYEVQELIYNEREDEIRQLAGTYKNGEIEVLTNLDVQQVWINKKNRL